MRGLQHPLPPTYTSHVTGLHTISAHGGVMDMRYTRIEFCQWPRLLAALCTTIACCRVRASVVIETVFAPGSSSNLRPGLDEVGNKTTWESIASIFIMLDNVLIACLWATPFTSFLVALVGKYSGLMGFLSSACV